MSYTPGPWIYGRKIYDDNFNNGVEPIIKKLSFDYVPKDFGFGASIFGPDGKEVVGNDEYQVFFNPDDIALIVSAPIMKEEIDRLKIEKNELLEALKEIINSNPYLVATDKSALRYVQAVDKARKVIDKTRNFNNK